MEYDMMDEIQEKSPLRIFLCHSSGDKTRVRALYQRLSSEGFDPWLDEEKLLPGQEWKIEIPKAVRFSHIVIICLSSNAINKAGYVQKEIKDALDVAEEQPEGTIYLIPLKLEECDVPERLGRWHWVNYYEENGYKRLMSSLRKRTETISSGRDSELDVL
ncbi:MAG: toll/interleukin-1 receptor domain-containing protein, partial [Clostridiaceae bacterium]|nr:toll/interleukin-1 receptor domain-containing protein [Clostridiaceae bacterium]